MVYVDHIGAPFACAVMCHMIADSPEELLAMAERIGVARSAIAFAGSYREHCQIALADRVLAVRAGAREITSIQLAQLLRARREGLAPVAGQ